MKWIEKRDAAQAAKRPPPGSATTGSWRRTATVPMQLLCYSVSRARPRSAAIRGLSLRPGRSRQRWTGIDGPASPRRNSTELELNALDRKPCAGRSLSANEHEPGADDSEAVQQAGISDPPQLPGSSPGKRQSQGAASGQPQPPALRRRARADGHHSRGRARAAGNCC